MATVDNSTQVIISTESGTGWSVDVTNANLDPLLTLKDFIVKFDGDVQNNADFTKTSQTIITYNGVALGSPTEVVIARDTPNDRVKCLTFGDRLQSAEYEAEFNRVHKLINENEISGSDNVKVTLADTTPGTLEDKIAEGADVLISVLNPGADEKLQISVSSPTSEPYVDINSALVVPNAVGTDAIAIGGGVTADGSNSVVLGVNALTDNTDFATDNCIVIGSGANIDPTPTTGSNSSFSIAIGTNSSITDGIASFAIGNGVSISDSDTSLAIGQAINIVGSTSSNNFALGSTVTITGGTQNVCIGSTINTTNATATINIGNGTTTEASSAIAIGSGAEADATSPNAIVLGVGSDAQGANAGIAFGAPALVRNTETVAISSATANGLRSISIGASTVSDGSSTIVIGNTAFTDNADFATENCIAIGFGASIDPTPTTGAVSNNSIAIGTNAAVLDATNAVQIGTGTNSTASTLQFLGNTLADANGLVNHLVNQDITSGVDITVTPGTSNDRLFITPTANINLILLTAGAVNTTHFTFVNLDPGTFNIDVKIDLVGNPTELVLGGGITNINVGYTGTDYRFYG